MFDIKVRTYSEALRFSRCLTLRNYAPSITDKMIGDMYAFLSANPLNVISMSNGMIHYVDAAGNKTDAHAVETRAGFDYVVMNEAYFRVTNTASSNDSGGCSGCSSNNNNNNNNNNG